MAKSENLKTQEVYHLDQIAAIEPFNEAEFSKTFSHYTAAVKDISLHYVIGGQGEPLLLLHGQLSSWYAFRKVLPLLAKRFTVIAADLPGLGDSTAPSSYVKKDIATYFHQLIQQLGYEKIFLVGHGIGGPVAFSIAVGRPNMISKLAFLDTILAGPEFYQIQRNSFPEAWHIAFNAKPGLAEGFAIGNERFYISNFFAPWSYNPAAISKAALDEYERIYSLPGKITANCSYYHTYPQDAINNNAFANNKLTIPILYLAGDQSMGNKRMGDKVPYQSIAKFAENSSYEIVENCGHHLSEERPIFLNQRLTEFFYSSFKNT